MEDSDQNPCNLPEMELCFDTESINVSPFAVMAPSNLPLTNVSVQPWKQSFFTVSSHGGSEDEASSGAEVGEKILNNERIQQSSSSLPPLNRLSPRYIAGDVTSGDNTSNNDAVNCGQILCGRHADPDMDPRKLKRIISNRVSAQKSRLKKVQYVADMERKLKALETHIAVLSPQVELYKNQQRLLQMEQKSLNQKIFSFSRNKLVKDAEIEENKAEVNRLRQLHLKLQQQHARDSVAGIDGWETALEQALINQSELGKRVSLHPNKDDGDRTAGGNGLSRFNLTNQHKMVEYKWMPTPGLRQVSEPNSNQLGHQEKRKPN